MGKKLRRRSRKSGNAALFWIIGLIFTFAVGGGLTWYFVKKSRKATTADEPSRDLSKVSPALKKVLEETDRQDPGWRLRDFAAHPRKMDDAKNGAKIVLNLAKQIPRNVSNSLGDLTRRQSPAQPLAVFEIAQLRGNLQACGTALAEARKLSLYPDGVYSIPFNLKSPLDTSLEHAQQARVIAAVLLADALVRAADRDGAGSLQSAQALLNISRYHADEPFLISQLVRVAMHNSAITALERALTCADVPDEALRLLQQTLEAEASTSGLYVALRGERANIDALAASAATGELNRPGASVSDDDVAWCIRQLNAMIELADKPVWKHPSEWQTVFNEIGRGSNSAKSIMPNVEKVRTALNRSSIQMRAAAIAVAAERYRRARGDWPGELKQLVPDVMKSLPPDPISGEPFHYARVPEGVSVYGLGQVGADFKGAFVTIGFEVNENPGFRLIQPNLRR